MSSANVRKVFGVLEGLSTTATSFVKEQHAAEGYPAGFMTFPDVEEHLGVARNVSGALVISYMPLVQSEDYELWSQYSSAKQGWISEANSNAIDVEPILPSIWDYPVDDRRELSSSCGGDDPRRSLAELERIPQNPENGPFSPVWTLR